METIHPKSLVFIIYFYLGGAAEGTRTPDPIITNDVLYHLSYSGVVARSLAPSVWAV